MTYKILSTIFCTFIVTACNSLPSHEKKILDGEALYYKGVQHLSGQGVQKDEKKALQYFQAASDKGYVSADNAIAVMYDEGIAVKQDKTFALKYYEKAAESNEASAQYNLAAYYYENDPTNPKLQRYLAQPVPNKDSEALNLKARIQMNNGNFKEAYQLFTKSAWQQNPEAFFYLYLMNKEGKGTPQNNQKALTYLRKSAELNQPNALFTLGTMYLKGEGVQQDTDKALPLLEKAAQMGHTKAIVNLAIMYQKGDGVEQNIPKFIQLLKVAAAQGDQQAIEALKTIK